MTFPMNVCIKPGILVAEVIGNLVCNRKRMYLIFSPHIS